MQRLHDVITLAPSCSIILYLLRDRLTVYLNLSNHLTFSIYPKNKIQNTHTQKLRYLATNEQRETKGSQQKHSDPMNKTYLQSLTFAKSHLFNRSSFISNIAQDEANWTASNLNSVKM